MIWGGRRLGLYGCIRCQTCSEKSLIWAQRGHLRFEILPQFEWKWSRECGFMGPNSGPLTWHNPSSLEAKWWWIMLWEWFENLTVFLNSRNWLPRVLNAFLCFSFYRWTTACSLSEVLFCRDCYSPSFLLPCQAQTRSLHTCLLIIKKLNVRTDFFSLWNNLLDCISAQISAPFHFTRLIYERKSTRWQGAFWF